MKLVHYVFLSITLFVTSIIILIHQSYQLQHNGNASSDIAQQLRRRESSTQKPVPGNTVETKHWFDEFLPALTYHTLIRANAVSKQNSWRQIAATQLNPCPNALMYLGWVAIQNMDSYAMMGGPSGEFVYWADLIVGIFGVI
jgi:hypothetical protein